MTISHKNIALLLGLFALASQVVQAQVAIIVGPQSTATALTQEQVSSLFLGKSDNLPGAGTALLFDQPESSAVREAFYTKATGKSAAQVKATWSRLIFSGKGNPPKELGDSAAIKKAVASSANAVGYVEKSAVDGSVKVLLTIE